MTSAEEDSDDYDVGRDIDSLSSSAKRSRRGVE
jgi:hypothetical protein